MKIISFDCETTGVDHKHGAKPFFVTVCHQDGTQQYWEWDVDPYTRVPQISLDDWQEIEAVLAACDRVVLQNGKFDAAAMNAITPFEWPWHKTDDTLTAGHVLASLRPHDLTSMALEYLNEDIEPYEKRLAHAVQKARHFCQNRNRKWREKGKPEWRLATFGLPEMPSCPRSKTGRVSRGQDRDVGWKFDYWLPKALLQDVGEKHLRLEMREEVAHWDTLLADYANCDSATTLALWAVQQKELKERGLWEIYEVQRQLLPIVAEMEDRGVTYSQKRLTELLDRYREESTYYGNVCVNIAHDIGLAHTGAPYELVLPDGAGLNGSVRDFCDDLLKLPIVKSTPGGKPSYDKHVMQEHCETLPPRSKQLLFVKSLTRKRGRDTAIGYLEAYQRFGVPMDPYGEAGGEYDDVYVIYPNLNPTGTDTLRFSMNNPNSANVKKSEEVEESLRYAFGPPPGREWFSLDAKNIERRIPAYEAKEEDIIALFERPNEGPYYGSEHLFVAHLLHPERFNACVGADGQIDGRIFKKRYASTWYQWVKNGNFCIQYGGQKKKADATFHVDGAFDILKKRFWKQEQLNQYWIRFAEKHGYVETIPDRTVNPKRGYPLMCARTDFGRVLPTVPLNYHVSGTAMWWMRKAMIRCQAQLLRWRQEEDFDGRMVLQVHDELVFEFPHRAALGNLWRVRVLQKLMEQGGDDIGIPTPVGIEYNPQHWAIGLAV